MLTFIPMNWSVSTQFILDFIIDQYTSRKAIGKSFAWPKCYFWIIILIHKQCGMSRKVCEIQAGKSSLWYLTLILHFSGRPRAGWLLVSSLEFGLVYLVIMLYFWAKHSTVRHLSPPKSINGYWGIAREAWWNAEGNLAVDWHLIMREVVTLIIASCFKDRDKLQLYGPLSLSTDLI